MGGQRVSDVRFASGAVSLAGILAIPAQDRCPAVVFVGGSGSADRDNDALFPPIRAHLLDAGIALLSYDKRGVGGSTGSWLAATIDDLASDCLAAAAILRREPAVDPDAVGLFGHSEGGWVVLRAAAGGDDVAFVITNAGPGTTPAEQDRHALAMALRADDRTDAEIAAGLAAYDRLMADGRRDAEFAAAVTALRRDPAYPLIEPYCGDLDAPTWTFLKRKQDHDPMADLIRLRCPHLALFGGADPLVPVARSAAAFTAAAGHADRAANATATVAVFPGADHRLRIDGATRFAPGYLDTVSGWIARNRVTN